MSDQVFLVAFFMAASGPAAPKRYTDQVNYF
jgi:hypothetical protein